MTKPTVEQMIEQLRKRGRNNDGEFLFDAVTLFNAVADHLEASLPYEGMISAEEWFKEHYGKELVVVCEHDIRVATPDYRNLSFIRAIQADALASRAPEPTEFFSDKRYHDLFNPKEESISPPPLKEGELAACQICKGTGIVADYTTEEGIDDCKNCDGTGNTRAIPAQKDADWFSQAKTKSDNLAAEINSLSPRKILEDQIRNSALEEAALVFENGYGDKSISAAVCRSLKSPAPKAGQDE